jgi:hypothetical protein
VPSLSPVASFSLSWAISTSNPPNLVKVRI